MNHQLLSTFLDLVIDNFGFSLRKNTGTGHKIINFRFFTNLYKRFELNHWIFCWVFFIHVLYWTNQHLLFLNFHWNSLVFQACLKFSHIRHFSIICWLRHFVRELSTTEICIKWKSWKKFRIHSKTFLLIPCIMSGTHTQTHLYAFCVFKMFSLFTYFRVCSFLPTNSKNFHYFYLSLDRNAFCLNYFVRFPSNKK